MNFTLADLLASVGPLGAGALLGLSIAGLLWKADDAVGEELKEDLALGISCGNTEKIPFSIERLYAFLFSENIFTISSFFRSALVSLGSVAVLFVCYVQIQDGSFTLDSFGSIALLALAFNVIPDFLSTIISRVLVRKLLSHFSYLRLAVVTFFDLLSTLVIAALALVIGSLVAGLGQPRELGVVGSCLAVLQTMIDYWDDSIYNVGFIGIFVYSTFFSTFILWAIVLSFVFCKQTTVMSRLQSWGSYALPVYTHPFRSIGIVGGMASAIIYVLVFYLSPLFSELTVLPPATEAEWHIFP